MDGLHPSHKFIYNKSVIEKDNIDCIRIRKFVRNWRFLSLSCSKVTSIFHRNALEDSIWIRQLWVGITFAILFVNSSIILHHYLTRINSYSINISRSNLSLRALSIYHMANVENFRRKSIFEYYMWFRNVLLQNYIDIINISMQSYHQNEHKS